MFSFEINMIMYDEMFFFLWRLVRPNQNGERAGPLAKMLLGAKHGGRPRNVSRIIVEGYFAL
jgi:hypothetical protein